MDASTNHHYPDARDQKRIELTPVAHRVMEDDSQMTSVTAHKDSAVPPGVVRVTTSAPAWVPGGSSCLYVSHSFLVHGNLWCCAYST